MAKFVWTVEIEADESLVADGFELTNASMQNIMERHLAYALTTATRSKVVSAPNPDDVAKVQGYKSAAHKQEREAQRRVG